MNASISNRIATLREQVGLTRHDLARLLGSHEDTVARWETGQTKVQKRYRVPLARRLKVRADDLGQED